MGSSSLARWHVERRCTPDFYADLEAAGGVILTEERRTLFKRTLVEMIAATEPRQYADAEMQQLTKEQLSYFKQNFIPRLLIATFDKAGGVPRGSWASDGRSLGGPFYRFVHRAYDAVPPRLRPRSPDRLCRLCQTALRAIAKSTERPSV